MVNGGKLNTIPWDVFFFTLPGAGFLNQSSLKNVTAAADTLQGTHISHGTCRMGWDM